MKKISKVLVSVLLLIAMLIPMCVSVSAASYPLVLPDREKTDTESLYAGSINQLVFKIFPEYKNEKITVYVYDEDEDLVATAEKTFYNTGYSSSIEFTLNWDTEGYEPGTYTIVYQMHYYSFMEWRSAPNAYEWIVVLKDRNAPKKNGWVQESGYWVFYENDKKITEQWQKDSKGWCYLDENGRMATNKWIKDSKGWCYVGADGYCLTNTWQKDSKGWCYLDANGRMATNKWVKDSKGWCYVGANGYCLTNTWQKDSKGWVYLDENGRMVTNKWVKDSKGWCYVGADGYAVTNCWKKDSTGWCYLDKNGSMMKKTWLKYNGEWYYINEWGYMVTGTKTINGKTYTFNASGVWVG